MAKFLTKLTDYIVEYLLHHISCFSEICSASEVTTLWRYTNLLIIIINMSREHSHIKY